MKQLVVVCAVVVVLGLAEGIWAPNRQKRQTSNPNDGNMTAPTAEAASPTPTPKSGMNTTGSDGTNTMSTMPTTVSESTAHSLSPPVTTNTMVSSSSTTTTPSTTTASTTTVPSSSSAMPRPTYLPPSYAPSNKSGYEYSTPSIAFNYPPHGKTHNQNHWTNSNWPSVNTHGAQWSRDHPNTNNQYGWMNHSRPEGKAPYKQQGNWNWSNGNTRSSQWMNRQQPNGWQNRPAWNRPNRNSPNTNRWYNQWKNSNRPHLDTPKTNQWYTQWKPIFGPHGNNANYGQWLWQKPQGNTANSNIPARNTWHSYRQNTNTQTRQWANNGNHLRPTNNKGGLWHQNWFKA